MNAATLIMRKGPILFEDELARIRALARTRGLDIRYRELSINGVRCIGG
ncbi:hypothetical protein [Vulcanisaeta sp. JCM 16161]|nr:hypothetical protein [Vulcanisaeta sp. JCM 16161]